MAEVKFGPNQTAVADSVPSAPTTAAPSQVPTVIRSGSLSLLSEDTLPQFADVILPRINMSQNIGLLKNSFPSGQIVFDQKKTLYDPPRINAQTSQLISKGSSPLIVTLLGWRPNPVNPHLYTRYTEKVEGGFGGMICNTVEEVRQNGGTLDYGEWELKKASGMRRFTEMVDGLFLIERPEIATPENPDADPIFTFQSEGNRYTLAFWSIQGSVYTEAYKKGFGLQRLTGILRPPAKWYSWSFAVSTREKPFRGKGGGTNLSWIPVIVPNQPLTPGQLAFARSVLNPNAAATEDTQ